MKNFTFSPGPEDGLQRLDVFLGRQLAGLVSREKIKKAVLQGLVRLNGSPCLAPKTRVAAGDILEIELAAGGDGRASRPEAEEGELDILYRDADLAVINKAAGLTVHPCPSCPEGTLVNRLLAHFPELGRSPVQPLSPDCPAAPDRKTGQPGQPGQTRQIGQTGQPGQTEKADRDEDEETDEELGDPDWEENEVEPVFAGSQGGSRPGIVHRLDKDTTGLILVALNEGSRLRLASDFAARRVRKEYLALVYGVPAAPEGSIDAPLGRDPVRKTRMAVLPPRSFRAGEPARAGRQALSEYRVLHADPAGRFSLLAVRIHTGRTHQIRVHLRHIGHPIIGDATYFDLNAVKKLFASGSESGGNAVPDLASLEPFLKRVASRPLLHAWRISLQHPQVLERPETLQAGPELSFCCPPPEDFFSAVRELSRRMQRVVLTGNSGCGKSSVLERLQAAGLPVWSADRAVAESYAPGGAGWQLLRSAFGSRFVPSEIIAGDANEKGRTTESALKSASDESSRSGSAPTGTDAGVDKKSLFRAMYDDESLRREVERLIHPIAAASMSDFFADQDFWSRPGAWLGLRAEASPVEGEGEPPASPRPVAAVAEVPLYFESLTKGERKPDAEAPLLLGVHCPFAIRAERLRTCRHWPDSMIEKMESWQWPEDKKMQACDLVLDNSGSLADLDRAAREALRQLQELREKRLEDIVARLRELTSCA